MTPGRTPEEIEEERRNRMAAQKLQAEQKSGAWAARSQAPSEVARGLTADTSLGGGMTIFRDGAGRAVGGYNLPEEYYGANRFRRMDASGYEIDAQGKRVASSGTLPEANPSSVSFVRNGRTYSGEGSAGIAAAVERSRADGGVMARPRAGSFVHPETRTDANGIERGYDGSRVYRDGNGNRITQAEANLRARSASPEAQARMTAEKESSMSPWQRKYAERAREQSNADRAFQENRRQFDINAGIMQRKNDQDFELGKLQSENQLAGTKDTNAANVTVQAGHDTTAQNVAETQNKGIMYQADRNLEGVKDTNAANTAIQAGHDTAAQNVAETQAEAQVDAVREQGAQARETAKLTAELTPKLTETQQGQRISVGGKELDEGQTRTLLDQVTAARRSDGTYDKDKLHAIAAQYGMTGFWDNDRWEEQLITLGDADYAKRYRRPVSPVTPANTGYSVQ